MPREGCIKAVLWAFAWAQDTLPDFIDPRKRLRPFELERKREGWVIIGYPGIDYDALRGFALSGVASIAYEGKRNDPTFEYEPYQHYFLVQGGIYHTRSRFLRFFYDAPWLGNRPYRVSLRISHRDESQGQFWGIGERFLSTYLPGSIYSYEADLKEPQQDASGMWYTRLNRHHFHITHWQAWASGEWVGLRGLLRVIGGLRWVDEKVHSLRGRTYSLRNSSGEKVEAIQLPTLLDSIDQMPRLLAPGLSVVQDRWVPRWFLGAAVVWDSRDFEIDPNGGWLIEFGHESLIPTLRTHKTYASCRQYHTFWRSASGKIRFTGALHLVGSATYGSRIFFLDLYTYNRWSDGQNVTLLSGPNTLRAFRENRFVTAFAYLLQYELRMRFLEARILRQHFLGGPTFFVDLGWGTDKVAFPRYTVWGAGIGVRLLWNMTTILRMDAAIAREGWQFHFHPSHTY
ncbi:MAG: DUF5982 domain-containing protein [Bacteroidia bacterium]